jgi:hypothetical protein
MRQSFRDIAQVHKVKRAYSVSLSNTAQQITLSQDTLWVFIFNNSNANVFIGDSFVSTSSGFPIPPKTSFGVAVLSPSDTNFYLISDSTGPNDVRIIEFS